MSYAIIATGGKQYRVEVGGKYRVENLDAASGETIEIHAVHMISNGETVTIGAPLLKDRVVKAIVLEHGRGDKVTIFKKRRRKGYQRKQGHRQGYTQIQITAIV